MANFSTSKNYSGALIEATESDGDSLLIDAGGEVAVYTDKSSIYKEPTGVAGPSSPKNLSLSSYTSTGADLD
jgi:hypothetical protein